MAKKEVFKDLNASLTIGKCKESKKHLKKFHRVGGIDVQLLLSFLERLQKEKGDLCIGVYVDKKKKLLAPIHCKGWMLAPKVVDDDYSKMKQDDEEF